MRKPHMTRQQTNKKHTQHEEIKYAMRITFARNAMRSRGAQEKTQTGAKYIPEFP